MRDLAYWRRWVKSYHDQAINYSLINVSKVATELGLHKFAVPVITVAGTNGKGSCVASMEALLQAHGVKVAAYSSPHMFNFCERIRLDKQPVAESLLCIAMQQIYACIAANNFFKLSYFEFATMAALLIFKQWQPDVILLEVGIGGRLDAVNVVTNDISVITSISLDHCALLGDNIEAIGFEKAGIIKGPTPIIYAETNIPESVLAQIKAQNAKLYWYQRDYFVTEHLNGWEWQSANLHVRQLPFCTFPLTNAAAALQAISLLPNIQLNSRIIKDTLTDLSIVGRFQVENVCGKEFIFDVAHNPAAVAWLAKKLYGLPACKKTIAIVATTATKDSAEMFRQWDYPVTTWLCCTVASMQRPKPEADLMRELSLTQTGSIEASTDITQAFARADTITDEGDRIIVFGSFHTVASALNELNKVKIAC